MIDREKRIELLRRIQAGDYDRARALIQLTNGKVTMAGALQLLLDDRASMEGAEVGRQDEQSQGGAEGADGGTGGEEAEIPECHGYAN